MESDVFLVYFVKSSVGRLEIFNISQLCVCKDLDNFFEFMDFLYEFLLFLFIYLPVRIGSGAFSPCGGLFRHFCGFVVSCGFVVLCTLLYTLLVYFRVSSFFGSAYDRKHGGTKLSPRNVET